MPTTQTIPFEKFEQAVMQKIMQEETAINQILRKQYKRATVTDRYFSGAGFFTDFYISSDAPRIIQPVEYAYGDVGAIINGVHVGFILFIKDGMFFMLEGYTWQEPDWPETIQEYVLVKDIIQKIN